MAVVTHKICVGDTATPLGFQCKQRQSNGQLCAVPLAGKNVKFSMQSAAGALIIDEDEAGVSVVAAGDGKCKYTFTANQVATAGTYYAWVSVYTGAAKDTFPVGNKQFVIQIDNPV